MQLNKVPYDLSHYVFQASRVGRIITLNTIPIEAGARISLDMAGVVQMSALRRNLTMDARFDVNSFFIPHRHHYGKDWRDFILQGVDENVTFTGYTIPEGQTLSYLGAQYRGEIPKWLLDGYNQIYNRYFVIPTAEGDKVDMGFIPTDTEITQRYGLQATWLPRIWNTAIEGEVDQDDWNVPVTAGNLSLLDLATQKSRLRTERVREWFGQRYNDVMQRSFGTSVNIDADERPLQVGRTVMWLSGYDVDGTDDATLGSYSGKAQAVFNHRIPRRAYPEHGVLWTVATLRFPSVPLREVHYLSKKVNPTYQEIAGDGDILVNEPPVTVDLNDYFSDSGLVSDAGIAPYGQHYRMHPDHVHIDYDTVDGYPFISERLNNLRGTRYVTDPNYEPVFQTDALGHYQVRARCGVQKWSQVPPVDASIFAGSR